MKKFKLHPLYEMDGAIGAESGVENVSAAEIPNELHESGVESQVAAEPNNFEKAFAKRLAAKEAEWEAKNSEKYKDYNTHKELSEYFQKINNSDALSLKERVEMEKLQERADQANVPPEVMKRLDELEAKAAKADELEQKQQQNEQNATYFKTLEDFTKDKGVDPKDLNQYMIDNGITYLPNDMAKSFNVALRAMKADQIESDKAAFEANKEQFKKDTLKEYLDSKKAPKSEGKGAAGIQGKGVPSSWQEADARALARIQSANNSV